MLVATATFSAAAQTPKEEPKNPADLVSEAREDLVGGDSYGAIPLLDQALESADIAPTDRALALYLRGVAHYREDNVLAAINDLRQAAGEPSLPEDMRASAAANAAVLARYASDYTGGVGGLGFSYNTLASPDDLAEMERQIDDPTFERLDADKRSERLRELAHEYASRGQWTKAKQLSARALAEARRSDFAFSVGSALMSQYTLAEMQGDHAVARTYLDQATSIYEQNGMLLTVPAFILEAIEKSEYRRNDAETCRHRSNLDRTYRKIASSDLEEDADRNRIKMAERNCPAT